MIDDLAQRDAETLRATLGSIAAEYDERVQIATETLNAAVSLAHSAQDEAIRIATIIRDTMIATAHNKYDKDTRMLWPRAAREYAERETAWVHALHTEQSVSDPENI